MLCHCSTNSAVCLQIKQVFYPGLQGSPGHELAKELFSGFGGVLAAELYGGEQAATAFIHVSRSILLIAMRLSSRCMHHCTHAAEAVTKLGFLHQFAAGVASLACSSRWPSDGGWTLQALKIPLIAVSLGGVESLVCVPAQTTHKIVGAAGREVGCHVS